MCYLNSFLVTQFTLRALLQCLVFNSPQPFRSQKEALLCLPTRIGHQYHCLYVVTWIERKQFSAPFQKNHREEKSSEHGRHHDLTWAWLTTARSSPSSFLSSYPATCGLGLLLSSLLTRSSCKTDQKLYLWKEI